jgi:flagellar biosynthesis protein FliR
VAGIGGSVMANALRLAWPALVLLLLVDLSLAMLNRIQTQLPLLSLAFPAKMLLCLALLGAAAPYWTPVFATQATECWRILAGAAGVR